MSDMEVNVITLQKGDERYVFIYSDEERSRLATLRMFGRMAADPELSFSWYDSAIMAKRVRETAQTAATIDSSGLSWSWKR